MNGRARLRCAIYTRVSTDEGMGQLYTSIDAQRDAGESYIASRRTEGWVPLGELYDDAGYSGGTLDRPALQRLIADVKAGRVDVVISYKLDRLSRSLLDFHDLIKVFDAHDVTFISVTQHFNTTDAMGRMQLNMLLAFAQYEREVTAERIRDKFAASKRKGLWMHGIPPLGYDVEQRRLAINPHEAEVVRWVFTQFLAVKSIQKLAEKARSLEYRNKSWTTKAGHFREGKVLDKSGLHKILHNRTYLDHLKHGDSEIPDTHPAIIEADLWAAVHALLSTNSVARGNVTRSRISFLLKGLVFAPDGRALIPWHTTKANGRLYRYYQTRETMERGRLSESVLPRLPANELEDIVLQQLREIFKREDILTEVVKAATLKDPTLDEARVTVAMRQIDRVWESLFPEEQSRLAQQLIERVVVTHDTVEIRMHALGSSASIQNLLRDSA